MYVLQTIYKSSKKSLHLTSLTKIKKHIWKMLIVNCKSETCFVCLLISKRKSRFNVYSLAASKWCGGGGGCVGLNKRVGWNYLIKGVGELINGGDKKLKNCVFIVIVKKQI